jgi:hypothetical protein
VKRLTPHRAICISVYLDCRDTVRFVAESGAGRRGEHHQRVAHIMAGANCRMFSEDWLLRVVRPTADHVAPAANAIALPLWGWRDEATLVHRCINPCPQRRREQTEFAAGFEAISTGHALINSDAQIG